MKKNRFNSTKKFLKQLNCSPNAKRLKYSKKLNNRSCYSGEALKKIGKYWNIRHPDNKIKLDNTETIWKFFKEKFSNTCHNERCWLRQSFIKNNNSDLLKFFAPESPKIWHTKPYTWLNSDDIEKVMSQYEHAYKNFEFIGPSPIDFDKIIMHNKCVWEELCNFSLTTKIKKNINKIGIIFNTDPHNKDGEHWIALFIDIKNSFISYFDSNGNKIPKEINTLIDRIEKQASHMGIKFKKYDNYRVVHQKNDGQCGMYTLYFVIELLLENKKPEYFKNTIIKDETMRDYRFLYYN